MNTKKLVTSALLAALCCIGTMIITIPTPTGGYVHAGDTFVILSGLLLGPLYGGLASGIGSCLSDLFLGYTSYVPATLIIKFLAAGAVGLIHTYLLKKKVTMTAPLLGGFASAIIVMFGYFLYEWLLTDNLLVGAISGIGGNLIQGLVSLILASLVYKILPSTITNSLR